MSGDSPKLASAIILVAITIASEASAATTCPTYQDARKLYPGHHLIWKGNHCWGPRQGAAADKREPSHAHNLKVAAEVDAAAKPKLKPQPRQHQVKLEDQNGRQPSAILSERLPTRPLPKLPSRP
jgi:hypothetical protein